MNFTKMAKEGSGQKGFSFTIDSIISFSNRFESRKKSSQRTLFPEPLLSIPTPLPDSQTECTRSSIPSMLPLSPPDDKCWREDEDWSECSESTVLSSERPLAPRERFTTVPFRKRRYENLDLEIEEGENQDQKDRCSSIELDLSVISTSSDISSPSVDSTSGRPKKKARTAFTTDQINQLEKIFQTRRYLEAKERGDLADRLNLTDQQVKTWFQNRRMKEKRQQKSGHSDKVPFPTGGVDISQLHVFGLQYPFPPPNPLTTASSSIHSSLPGPYPPPYFASEISSSPYLPAALRDPMPVSSRQFIGLPVLSQFSYHPGYSQFAVSPFRPSYPFL